MRKRVKLEVGDGAEPWGPNLQRLSVFIPSEPMFERWRRACGVCDGDGESREGLRLFWEDYLRKLVKDANRAAREQKRGWATLTVELFETSFVDFLGHFFDYDREGGYVTGAHLLSGTEAPMSFKVQWPSDHFDRLTKALEDLKGLSKKLM